MNKHKCIVAAAAAVVLSLGLASCSSPEVSTTETETGVLVKAGVGRGTVSIVEVPDGDRTVKCAVLLGNKTGGLSCDWGPR